MIRAPRPRVLIALLTLVAFVLSLAHVRAVRADIGESPRSRATETTKAVIELGQIGELRPNDGVLLLRMPVNATVTIEDARSLKTGARVEGQSGYLLSDVRHSVLAKTSFRAAPAATIRVQDAEYDAWGSTVQVSGLAAPTHRFVNKEPDPLTDYYHFGLRTYDPSLRRWLSPDPLFLRKAEGDATLGQQFNLFGYAGNVPTTKIDERGTAGVLVEAAAGGVLLLGGGLTLAYATNEPFRNAVNEFAKGVMRSAVEIAVEGARNGGGDGLNPGDKPLVDMLQDQANRKTAESAKQGSAAPPASQGGGSASASPGGDPGDKKRKRTERLRRR